MTPRLDDATIEYQFADIERIAARFLDPVKIAWFQTKYAEAWKIRASTPVPEEAALDRSYFLKIAEYDGFLRCIQEILDDHRKAIMELNERKAAGENIQFQTTDQTLAERAAAQVHKIQTG
jgi:hypothetical protein